MEIGKIYISTDESNNSSVIFEPTNGTIWLAQHEIASLFDVYIQTIGNNLCSIFKADILRENEVSYTHRYTVNSGKYKECQTVFYNLDVIIALAYRIKSKNAEVFREWLTERICKHEYSQSTIIFQCGFDNVSLN